MYNIFYLLNVPIFFSDCLHIEFQELVSTGDGDYRLVYAINGQIPGPEIVVMEGDMVSLFNLNLEVIRLNAYG